MSGDASKTGSGNRRLLAKVQHSIPPAVIFHVLPHMEGRRDVVDPLVVECRSSPSVAFTLAFDMLEKKPDGSYKLDVMVRGVVAPPNMALQFYATIEYYSRPKGADVSLETDKSKWPAPKRLLSKFFLKGKVGGRICHFKSWSRVRSLTVNLGVYAVGDAPFGDDLPGILNALRLEETLSDVKLMADGEVFPAHRNVLAARSPVFRAMFTSDFKEAQDGVVEIGGASSTAFGLFLQFLYTAIVDDWKGCELELLELADRYMVDHLKAVCEERLLSLPHLALTVLQEAAKPVITGELRAKAARVVFENWNAVSNSQQWKDFEASQPVAAALVLAAKGVNLPGAQS